MADLWWVLKLKQRIYLFILSSFTSPTFSFSFLSTPLIFVEPLHPKTFENLPQVLSFQVWSHFQPRSFVQAQ